MVDAWDAEKITVSLHPYYHGDSIVPANTQPDALAGERSQGSSLTPEETESDDEGLEDLGDETEMVGVNKPNEKASVYTLTHSRFSELMRPQHALLYANIQGTLKDRICLMDVTSPNMTVRDIITSMSRPTKQSDLKVMSPDQQRRFMARIREKAGADGFDLEKRAQQVTLANSIPSDRRTPSRVGRY